MSVNDQERLVFGGKGRLLFNVPMSKFTSLRIGGPADVMAFPVNENDLKEIIHFAAKKGFPVTVLGAGTNMLVRDGGIRGLVINLMDGFDQIVFKVSGHVEVGAGVKLSHLVNVCSEKGLSDIEFATGIPGTVGGAVAMNAGAYGMEIGHLVTDIEAIDLSGKVFHIEASRLNFTYRGCSMPDETIILKVSLVFNKDSVEEIKKRVDALRKKRMASQLIKYPNAGSIFKNPGNGEMAGRLIEEVGLKGMRIGNAKISKVHANHIVNLGNAKASDVMSLMAMVRDRVHKLKGIVLEPEIRVVGEA